MRKKSGKIRIFILFLSAEIVTIPQRLYRKPVKKVRMKGKIVQKLLLLFCGAVILFSGCATENQFFVNKIPFLEARSDVIPGLDSPHQRKKTIQEKGTKGATASEAEKEILVAQLMYEYQTSPDSNMRREAVDALAKIPHPDRDKHLREILKDDNPFVRLSALEALGKTYSSGKEDLIVLLINQMKTDPDNDVRLSAIRILGDVCNLIYKNSSERTLADSVVLELGNLLQDRVLAVRYESMRSLHKVTGKDYGHDVNRWLQYIRYVKGEVPNLPTERKVAEKVPTIALPMFK
jgi:hypothetical protein